MILNKHEENGSIENIYNSSNILASKYIIATKKLAIIFKGGRQYLYHDVKREDYNIFENSESQGKVLNTTIKKYKSEKIEEVVNVTPLLEQISILKANG
ncbi:hypothetical protein CL614_08155 [archaeon]|nr:hypothetical protein [archaeon]|tara:strand:- start:1203 stop:1499 length:297 start_codon:yes stop_codon:yes gene_type:complete